MAKLFLRYFVIGAVAVCLLCMPRSMYAAEIHFVPVPNTVPGDTATIIEARIDPGQQNVNAVEGTINFQPVLQNSLSVEISTDNSMLTIWPVAPSFNKDTHDIDFTGGVPGGFTKEGMLFRMRLTSSLPGTITISAANVGGYLNDGKGTAVSVTATPLAVAFNPVVKNNSHASLLKYDIIGAVIFIGVILLYMYGSRKKSKK